MSSERRMGPKGSDVWISMLDAAEIILIEEGAVALTSRLVAERTGVKQRLVYYYFRTMDELVVETFRRLADRERSWLEEGLKSEHSVRRMWNVFVESPDTRLVSEFMALTHRIEALRVEIRDHVEICRGLQIEALTRAMSASGKPAMLTPAAAALIAMSVSLTLNREAGIGVKTAHEEVRKVIADFLDLYDPED
jgi:AcrR family transcriptional regulator